MTNIKKKAEKKRKELEIAECTAHNKYLYYRHTIIYWIAIFKMYILKSRSALSLEGESTLGVSLMPAPSLPHYKSSAIQYICVSYYLGLPRV